MKRYPRLISAMTRFFPEAAFRVSHNLFREKSADIAGGRIFPVLPVNNAGISGADELKIPRPAISAAFKQSVHKSRANPNNHCANRR